MGGYPKVRRRRDKGEEEGEGEGGGRGGGGGGGRREEESKYLSCIELPSPPLANFISSLGIS